MPICKYGHTSGFYSNGRCIECRRISAAKSYQKDPEKVKKKAAEFRTNNPEYIKQYYKENAAKQAARKLIHKYNITFEEKQQMFVDQNGECGNLYCYCIFKTLSEAQVDHNHTTKKVRRLLCKPCNTSLGLLQEDPNRIRGLAKYIEANPQ